MADKTDSQRLVDLKGALRKARPNSRLSLSDCAALWGVTKPRFVNKRAEMSGFPDPVEIQGNAHLYDAKTAIRAMIAQIEGHQAVAKSRAARMAVLVGDENMAGSMGSFSIAELAKANQLSAELEQRQRDQGLYIPRHDVERTVGMAFSEISEFMSNLSNIVDPHGRLSPDVRALIDSNGHEQLLTLHANLKGMLSPDAVDTSPRKPAGKPRKAPARRPSKRSRPRKA